MKSLSSLYENLFDKNGGQRAITVKNVLFNNQGYDVVLNKSITSKVVGDKNLTAEKLAVIEMLDDVVSNANFVGSGDYVQHAKSQSKVTRYDYFEMSVNIKGKEYIDNFLGENSKNVLWTKENKSIDELLSVRLQLPQAVADDTLISNYNMPQSQANVNISQQIDYDIPISTKIQNNLDMLKQQPHIRLMTGEEFAKSDIGLVKQVG